jgi:hypothetical protein
MADRAAFSSYLLRQTLGQSSHRVALVSMRDGSLCRLCNIFGINLAERINWFSTSTENPQKRQKERKRLRSTIRIVTRKVHRSDNHRKKATAPQQFNCSQKAYLLALCERKRGKSSRLRVLSTKSSPTRSADRLLHRCTLDRHEHCCTPRHVHKFHQRGKRG